MNIAVAYRSMTGHSKKIARLIAAEFSVEAQNIKAKPIISGVDLLFIVGGIYSGASLSETTEFVKTLTSTAVKTVALITSSAANKKGQDEVRSILEANGVAVEGEEYRCFGNFLFIKAFHPNKNEKSEAVEFAKKIAAKCSESENNA